MKPPFFFLHLVLFWTLLAGPGSARADSIGIPRQSMDFCAAAQDNSNWCWAASIQMVMNFYGVSVSQEDIVGRSFGVDPLGRLPNWAGSLEVITRNLNGWGFDRSGRQYRVGCQFFQGAPPPIVLTRELSQGRPVIVGYDTGSGGHAVVITAAEVQPTPGGPFITEITVRDPWPSDENVANRGRKIFSGAELARRITGTWVVGVGR